ncbi:hypothetical protein ACTWPT_06650 [Nonomuraea sp. 3N208]|uniref:hypothetical protein n=1 Tax=Nonomuraea sp. 3N208 TaxID=3457421 RepID=UPI003FCE8146
MVERLLNVKEAGWPRIFVPIGVFLAAFGVFNFAELPLGWKDRVPQITRYLEATVGLGAEWVPAALWTAKTVELALGVIAIIALVRRHIGLLATAVLGWMAWFISFSALDVWAADRAELQEHTVYFVMFTVLLVILLVVNAARQALQRLEGNASTRIGA